jgi:hypothetical protein
MIKQFNINPKKHEALFAAGVELVLDGLHLSRKLNRDKVEGKFHYKG